MTIRMSPGLCHAAITDYGVGRMVQGGYIAIYSGAQPPSASTSAPGTLLARITQDGAPMPIQFGDEGGLNLQPGGIGEIVNAGNWVMTCVASGTPGWWRFYAAEIDLGDDSQIAYRIDGTVGESVHEIPATLTSGETLPVASFSLRFLP